jgi:WD40 repeat protein
VIAAFMSNILISRSPVQFLAALVAIAASCTSANAQSPPTNASNDNRWVTGTASATLVPEPLKLKDASHWTIESRRHRGIISASTPSPDGTRLATGGVDGIVRIWNMDTGSLDRALMADRFGIYSMAWSPDGARLATIAYGGARVRIWDVATGRQLAEPKPHGHLSSLTWSHDSRRLGANHPADGSGRIYVSDSLADFKVVKEAGKRVVALAWSSDSSLLAYAVAGEPANVVETSGWSFRYSLDQRVDGVTRLLGWSPDGTLLATVGDTGAAVWKSADGTAVSRTAGFFSDIAWDPDSSRFLAASAKGIFVNAADGKAGDAFAGGGRLHWNAKTGRITTVTADTIKVWEPGAKEPAITIDAGGTHAPVFEAGKPVVTGIGTKVLSVSNQTTFKRITTLEGHTGPVTHAAWSRDGKHFATAGADGTVCLWNVEKGEQLATLAGHKGGVTALAWAPDSDSLASAGIDKTVRLWTAEGEEKGVLAGHTNLILSVAWAPKGDLVASGGRDQKIMVWSLDTGDQVRTIDCPAWVTTLDWTTVKGVSAIACGLQDGGAKVFNASTGSEIATVIQGTPSWAYGFGSIAWSQGGQPGLLTSRWHLAQLWDIGTKDTLARQITPGGGTAVFPTAGGKVAVVRAADRTLRLWDPADNGLRGVLLDDDGRLAAISTKGDVKFDPEAAPDLIAIVETADGHQHVLTLGELKSVHGWKNSSKAIKLPTRN